MKHSNSNYDYPSNDCEYKYEKLLMRYKKLYCYYKNLLMNYKRLYDCYTELCNYYNNPGKSYPNNNADGNYGNSFGNVANDAITITKVSKISIKNSAWVVTKFVLNANENVMYASGNKAINQSSNMDLKALGIQPGIQFSIIADVRAGADSRNNEILEYSPDSNYEIKYKLNGTTGSSHFTKLN